MTLTAYPAIITKLREWGVAFGDWIILTAIPWLLLKAAELQTALITWLRDTALPAIKEKLGEWAAAFAAWVMDTGWPLLLTKLGELKDALFTWFTDTALPGIRDKLFEFAGAIGGGIADIVSNAFGAVPDAIGSALRLAGGVISDFLRGAAGVAETLGLSAIAGQLSDAATTAGTWGHAPTRGDRMSEGGSYAAGGRITGGVPGKDSVPAMLTPGEVVIRKSSVDKYGLGNLLALNEGRVPGFAEGGRVRPQYAQITAHLRREGVGHKIESTIRDAGPTSAHTQGRAVDLNGPGGEGDIAGGLRILGALWKARGSLSELLYSHDQSRFLSKDGVFSAREVAIHWNHVHAAIRDGVIIPGSDPPAPARAPSGAGGGRGLLDTAAGAARDIVGSARDKLGELVGLARSIVGGALDRSLPRLPVAPGLLGVGGAAGNKIRDGVISMLKGEAEGIVAADAAEPRGGGPQGGGLPGSTTGLNPEFLRRFQAYSSAVGGLSITSGFRSREQQAYLHDRWVRRVPGQAQAAPPGSSQHEVGLAIDHSPHSTAAMRDVARGFQLYYPMSFEPWHVQPLAKGGEVKLHPNSFDAGGTLKPGWNMVRNDLGRDEPVAPSGGTIVLDQPIVLDGAVIGRNKKVYAGLSAQADANRRGRV